MVESAVKKLFSNLWGENSAQENYEDDADLEYDGEYEEVEEIFMAFEYERVCSKEEIKL